MGEITYLKLDFGVDLGVKNGQEVGAFQVTTSNSRNRQYIFAVLYLKCFTCLIIFNACAEMVVSQWIVNEGEHFLKPWNVSF